MSYHLIPYQSELSKDPKFKRMEFSPVFPPFFIMHFIFSKKFGLINYSGGNYNPLVILQSPSEELRVFYKYKLINRPAPLQVKGSYCPQRRDSRATWAGLGCLGGSRLGCLDSSVVRHWPEALKAEG